MKKLTFVLLLLILAIAGIANAQSKPTTYFTVYDDSTDTRVWTIGGGVVDADTSQKFYIHRMPEGGLSFHFYTNCGDSGTVVATVQVTSLWNGPANFAADSAAAIEEASWAFGDSITLPKAVASGTTAARSSYVWNPTLKGGAQYARLILSRAADKGTVSRVYTIVGIRQD